MKNLLAILLLTPFAYSDDIFLECNEIEAITNASDYTVVLDMENKTADVSITDIQSS